MRLNRVLLLAATINILIFALAFTISCSGDDGKNGSAGGTCVLAASGEDDGIWQFDCNGETVEIRGGNGTNGTNGIPGADGEDCRLSKGGSGYEIRCGGTNQLRGSLEGCSILTNETSPSWVTLFCGKSEVNMCSNRVFDPAEDYCNGDGEIIPGGASVFGYCGPKKIKYNTNKQYCGYGEDDEEKYGDSATVYDWCGTDKTAAQPNQTEWNEEEYCRYWSAKPSEAALAGLETGDYCNGAPINKDGWKGEYCGYASNDSKVKSVITGICDLPAEDTGIQGPNELAFGQGYCEVEFGAKKTGKTIYSEKLCGTSAENKPNNGKWKNEYCGYANASSVSATKVYAGLCDDSEGEDLKGPNLEAYNAGYCIADRTDSTHYTDEDFCGDDPTQRPNDGAWKGEYCGYESATGTAASKVYSGICDDDQGPNQDSWNPDQYCQFDKAASSTFLKDEVCENGDKINEGTWKGEYCGYASKTASKTSMQTGICDDGTGPNSVEFGGGYCTVSARAKKDTTEYTDEFCGNGGKPNNGKWNGEYCGYASKNSEDDDKVWTGVCDDGMGKYKGEYRSGANDGYCEANEEGVTAFSTTYCGTSGKVNEGTWKGEYCFADEKVSKCAAGLKPDASVKSTNAYRCVLPATIERCEASNLEGGLQKGEYSDNFCRIIGENPTSGKDASDAIELEKCVNKGKILNTGRKDAELENECIQITDVVSIDDCVKDVKKSSCIDAIDGVLSTGKTLPGSSLTCMYASNKCTITSKQVGNVSIAFTFVKSACSSSGDKFKATCKFTP
jgi:hypothetical protein